jgi:hypothetical protein
VSDENYGLAKTAKWRHVGLSLILCRIQLLADGIKLSVAVFLAIAR